MENIIEEFCKVNSIKNYTINPDGSIDVDYSVYINRSFPIKKLPIKFNKVSGNFICSGNQLTSLEGCPNDVGGSFDCSHNQLTSLVGGPIIIGRGHNCMFNQLTSLEGCPEKVGKDFTINCDENPLISLDGIKLPYDRFYHYDRNVLIKKQIRKDKLSQIKTLLQ